MSNAIRSWTSSFRTTMAGALLSAMVLQGGCGAADLGAEEEAGALQQELQAASARAVYFSRMLILQCPEIGTCDWRLQCRMGSSTTLVTLLDGEDGDTGESIPIERAVLNVYPLTAKCWVDEHDGGFGGGWEPVGSAEVRATPGSWYSLRMRNNEGDVIVQLRF